MLLFYKLKLSICKERNQYTAQLKKKKENPQMHTNGKHKCTQMFLVECLYYLCYLCFLFVHICGPTEGSIFTFNLQLPYLPFLQEDPPAEEIRHLSSSIQSHKALLHPVNIYNHSLLLRLKRPSTPVSTSP